MNLNLFDQQPCDHLPVWDRLWRGDWLICHKCGARLRPKNYLPELINGKR